MNKKFKLLSAVLGMMSFTGCVNDDIPGLSDAKVNLSGKYALTVNVEDAETRAYKDADGSNFTFVSGDVLRVYNSIMRENDEFKLDEGSGQFLTDAKNAYVKDLNGEGKVDYAYALFTEANCLSEMTGWNKGRNLAIVKIPASVNYSTMTADESGTVLYKSALPMWGTVKSLVEAPVQKKESGEAEQSFETTLHRMTGQAKVIFDAGASRYVTSVRVRSLMRPTGVTGDNIRTMRTALEAMTLEEQTAAYNNNNTDGGINYFGLTETNATPLANGWFQGVLTNADGTLGDGHLEPIEFTTNSVVPATGKTFTVNLPTGSTDAYKNVVYLPIVPNHYDVLLFEYKTKIDDEEKWHYLKIYVDGGTSAPLDITRETALVLTVAGEINDNEILYFGANTNGDKKALETALNTYKDGNVTINVTNSIFALTNIDKQNTLTVPALTGDVVVNIKNNIASVDNQDLKIVGGGGNGKLTLNFATMSNRINIDNYEGDIEINGTMASAINAVIAESGHLTLGGSGLQFGDNNIKVKAKNLTLGNVGEATNGSFGTLGVDEVENVEVTGKCYASIENTSGRMNVTVTGDGEVVKTTNKTHMGDVTRGNIVALGDVLVDGIVNGGNVTVGVAEASSLVVNGNGGKNIGTIKTHGAPVTIDLKSVNETTGKVTLGVASAVQVAAPAEVKLLNGYIGKVSRVASIKVQGKDGEEDLVGVKYSSEKNFTKENQTKLHSEGVSAITSVTGLTLTNDATTKATTADADALNEDETPWIVLDSKWCGELEDGVTLTESYLKTQNIYTACQFAEQQKASASYTLEDMKLLHADLDMDNQAYNKRITAPAYFNGYGHTIKNLKLAAETTNDKGEAIEVTSVGLFTAQRAITTIKNLTIENVSTEFTGEGTVAKVGALIGDAARLTTIDNVNVNGGSLTAPDNNQSHDFGGLIGGISTVIADNKITNSKVNLTSIKGYYNLGGIVGSVNGNLTVTDSPATISGFALSYNDDEETLVDSVAIRQRYGTVGFVIGTILNADKNITISAKDKNVGSDASIAGKGDDLKFKNNYYFYSTGNKKYTFSTTGHVNAIGYSKVLANSGTGCDNGAMYDADGEKITEHKYDHEYAEEETKVSYNNKILKVKDINTLAETTITAAKAKR